MQKICYALEVYPFQIDYSGHVNNSVYIQWMEIGRTKLLEAIGMPLSKLVQQGVVPILVQTNIIYKSPVYLHDQVRIELWISELRNASAIMQFQFQTAQESLVAEGSQKGLFVDHATMHPKRLSAEQRALFMPYVINS